MCGKLLDTLLGVFVTLGGLTIIGFFMAFYFLGEGRNVGSLWLVLLFGVVVALGGICMIWRTWFIFHPKEKNPE